MSKQVCFRLLLALGLACSFAFTASAEVAVWGSTTCQKRFLEPGAEAFEKATGMGLKVFGVGTGKGMMALVEGKAQVAAASSSLQSAIGSLQKEAGKQGTEIAVPENIQFHQIAEDAIVPIVNTENPVEALSWEQLSGLNTGAIANWKEVGGADLPVHVVTSHEGSATRSVFQKIVMKKADYAAKRTEVKSTRLEINEVSADASAIGAVSAGFHSLNPGKTKVVKADPITRPLALITLGDPTPEVQKVIDFFRSAEGKKYIVD